MKIHLLLYFTSFSPILHFRKFLLRISNLFLTEPDKNYSRGCDENPPVWSNDRIIIQHEGRARHLAPYQPYYSRQMGVFDRAKRSRLSVETRGASVGREGWRGSVWKKFSSRRWDGPIPNQDSAGSERCRRVFRDENKSGRVCPPLVFPGTEGEDGGGGQPR